MTKGKANVTKVLPLTTALPLKYPGNQLGQRSKICATSMQPKISSPVTATRAAASMSDTRTQGDLNIVLAILVRVIILPCDHYSGSMKVSSQTTNSACRLISGSAPNIRSHDQLGRNVKSLFRIMQKASRNILSLDWSQGPSL